MAKQIMTVTGPIAPEELGWTSMHEHILMDGRVLYENARQPEHPPVPPDAPMSLENVGIISHNGMLTLDAVDLQDEALMMGETADFVQAGGQAMVELSAIGIRCNTAGVRRIAEANGVRVVACTGFYIEESWPDRYRGLAVEDFADIMLREVEDGIEDTGVRPGVLKIAMNRFGENEENALRAAVRVALETGLSLTLHPPGGHGAGTLEAVRLAVAEGLDPARLVVAHIGSSFVELELRTLITRPESWRLDLTDVHRLLDMGVNVSTEFLGQNVADEFGGSVGTNDWQRLAGIYALIGEGYTGQIVLGADLCAKMLTRRFGGQGYLRLWNFALPTLRELGVAERAIRQIMVENPARILAY